MLKNLSRIFAFLIFIICINSQAFSDKNNPLCSEPFWTEADAENVLSLLNSGRAMNDKCSEGELIAFDYAFIFMQDPSILNIFSSRDLDYSVTSERGSTLLHSAARGRLPQAINFLVKKNLPINKVNSSGTSAFLIACMYADVDIIKAFVENGADIHQASNDGKNCLYEVLSSNGQSEAIEYVLDLGLSKDFSRCKDCWPIVSAYVGRFWVVGRRGVIQHQEKILDLLIQQGFDINEYHTEKKTRFGELYDDVKHAAPIFVAIRSGNKKVVSWLLERGVDPNYTSDAQRRSPIGEALLFIDENPDFSIISLLVFHGAELNTTKTTFGTPLTNNMYKKYYPNLADHLIELGADIEFRDRDGRTPLLYAAKYGYYDAFEFLLSRGANLHAIDSDERNVLHLASQDNSLGTVKKLFEAGFDTKKLDKYGFSPLHLASLHTDNPLIIRYLAGTSIDINAKTKTEYRNPPLHLALWNARYNSIARELIKLGADVNLRNAAGLTPLHVAAITCGEGGYSKTAAIMKILIGNGAQINAMDKENNTPLHYASKSCYHPKPASLLFKSGANARARNINGETPFDLISKNNDLKDSKLFWDMRDKLLQ